MQTFTYCLAVEMAGAQFISQPMPVERLLELLGKCIDYGTVVTFNISCDGNILAAVNYVGSFHWYTFLHPCPAVDAQGELKKAVGRWHP